MGGDVKNQHFRCLICLRMRMHSFRKIASRFWGGLKPSTAEITRKVVNGDYIGDSKRKSIAYFTLYKAGSTFFASRIGNRALKDCPRINLEAFCQHQYGHSDYTVLEVKRILRTPGLFFAPLRTPVEADLLDAVNALVVVRDPRDILTSLYFSIKYSHKIYTEAMKSARERLQKMTLDDFVLGPQADTIGRNLITYASWRSMKNMMAIKYEDIIEEPSQAEDKMREFLRVEIQSGELFNRSDFTVDKEDVMSHKRRVTPGDYLEKLKPETIRALNRRLADALEAWEYAP